MSGSTESWVVVLETRDQRRSNEAGLVLMALSIEYEVTRLEGRWLLSVPARLAPEAAAELSAYAAEDRAAPVGARPLGEIGNGRTGVLVYAGILILVAVLTRRYAFGHDWLGLGRVDSARILSGEWWRVLTALTLHVDLSHLAGNVVFGGFFGLYVGRYLGPGVGWAGILAGGAIGNALNVFIQPERHLSIGASTAVFAALGILTAYTWRRGFLRDTPWRTRIAPVTAGIGLLAFTGTGSGMEGENVDVIAHLTGFISGFGIGVFLAGIELPRDFDGQKPWGALAIGSLILAWFAAFGAGSV